IRLLRRMCAGSDPLFPSYDSLKQTGAILANAALRRALSGLEMGTYSMSPASLNFLEEEIRRNKPGVVLEFGSGVSTMCLAQYMRELHGAGDRIYVYSIEQDRQETERTRERVRELGLESHVRVFHAPLAVQTIEGRTTLCYSLPAEFKSAMEPLGVDFLL